MPLANANGRFAKFRLRSRSPHFAANGNLLLPQIQESLLELGYYVVVSLAWFLFLATFPVSLLFCVKIVHEYKRMVG